MFVNYTVDIKIIIVNHFNYYNAFKEYCMEAYSTLNASHQLNILKRFYYTTLYNMYFCVFHKIVMIMIFINLQNSEHDISISTTTLLTECPYC